MVWRQALSVWFSVFQIHTMFSIVGTAMRVLPDWIGQMANNSDNVDIEAALEANW